MLFRKITLTFIIALCFATINAQQMNSAQILHHIKKLKVNASVLYIAAHPDDENTRLLTYLANERMYRTGYLSLTRGDGGQNLIGNEQGVDLGLIRTQELLAARRIDGAEQFFTTAFDFGFSKTSAETFAIWDKEKILADVVWVIRKFKPDVIITRFPEDTRAGHGHHAASGILAREAFYAAADKNKFKEQFKYGVGVWQAKRIVWNTFNFGATNTTSESQMKIDVGGFNPLLGKSYGEIAAESRSQHKSQGFGVPSQRGSQTEYFTLVGGDSMKTDIMDGVETETGRLPLFGPENFIMGYNGLQNDIDHLVNNFSMANPAKHLKELLELYKKFQNVKDNEIRNKLVNATKNIIINSIGLYMEATTNKAFATQGDSLKINFSVNARLQDSVQLKNIFYKKRKFDINTLLTKNNNFNTAKSFLLDKEETLTQPYWLVNPKEVGRFIVTDQNKIGNADGDYEMVQFVYEIMGELFVVEKKIQFKFTDPVKGEIFQPLYIVPSVDVSVVPNVVLNTKKLSNIYEVHVKPRNNYPLGNYFVVGDTRICDTIYRDYVAKDSLIKDNLKSFVITNHSYKTPACGNELVYSISNRNANMFSNLKLSTIEYDHIPTIAYTQKATVKLLYDDIITSKKRVGYIVGAGDKVPDALKQLGYTVDFLTEKDIVFNNIIKYDAIITGIRAYNTNDWMNNVYEELMRYTQSGGNLIVQYNTSNQIGPVKAKIAPYPFTISRNRITEENAAVAIINKEELILNKPNKITPADFNNWIQERSVYEATDVDANYRKVFTMNDTGEKPQDGSIIIAKYGKGNFVYCSLALFRQLPAGVSGAYKLFANIIELPKN